MRHSLWKVHRKLNSALSISAGDDVALKSELLYQTQVQVGFVRAGTDSCIEQRIVFEVRIHPTSNDRWHRAQQK
jgi:hypothetical protein